jgi:hypothetical protein
MKLPSASDTASTQTWEAHVRPGLKRVCLIAARPLGSEAWLAPNALPAHVREFLEVDAHNRVAPDAVSNIADLEALVANDSDIVLNRPDVARLDWYLAFAVAAPVELKAPICVIDIDGARYEGDERDGIYYDAAEGPGGWYLSAIVDCDSSGFTDTYFQDDGPYESREAAMLAGQNAARDWCIDNDVRDDDDG